MAFDANWRPMEGAPKDGTRVIVTICASEQGPSEVDVAYWSEADQAGLEGWRAADSHPGQVFLYAESELMCWMPLPHAGEGQGGVARVMPEPWEGSDPGELYGSGI